MLSAPSDTYSCLSIATIHIVRDQLLGVTVVLRTQVQDRVHVDFKLRKSPS